MAVTTQPPKPAGTPVRALVSPRLARLSASPPRRRIAGHAVAVAGTVVLTAGLLPVRNDLTPLSKGFGYLVVVVAAAAIGGLWPGIVASVLGFLAFNFFFIPPYNTFVVGRGEDVVVLFVFLGLSILISALLARATDRAQAAEAREAELRLLQTLSADLVAAVPGPETYEAVLTRLLGAFGFDAGALFVQDPVARELRERVAVGAAPGELSVRWNPGGEWPAGERLPLSVGGRNLGLFVLAGDRPPLASPESRVLRAFCDEFALLLERDRLLRTAAESEAYRQADQVRRSLLAAVSHDLRTPLAAIKTSVTDLLADDGERPEGDAREALETIDQETDRLAALVANLLDMSRIEGGMLKANPRTVDAAEILGPCIDRIERQWRGLSVRVRTSSQGTVVRADPLFLDRVFTNLLDNAARASADAGANGIEVETRRDGDRVQIRIVDHGAGVPPAVREQLFYPFYQVTERHPRLGTGLGLPIAKGFLARMGGEIWIEETPGGGATFAVSLPAATG